LLKTGKNQQMIFPLISLRIWGVNRGMPDIGFQVNDEDCSGLSSLFPDVFAM
jgi:hypothetical protein